MVIAAALAAILVISLAGCDSFLPDPLAFTKINGQPVVRTCIPLQISTIKIQQQGPAQDQNPQTVWSATGDSVYPGGSEFVLGQAPEGMKVAYDGATNYLGGTFIVEISVTSHPGGSWTTHSEMDLTRLSEGRWLDGNGQPTEVPCTRDSCMPLSACYNDWPIPTGYPTQRESTFVPSTPKATTNPG